jgi:hypothetical protein
MAIVREKRSQENDIRDLKIPDGGGDIQKPASDRRGRAYL